MFSQEFDLIFGAILLILAVVFFMGKGKGVLDAFRGRNAPKQKKLSPEEERKYQLVIAVYLAVLGGCEMGMAFYSSIILDIASMIVAVVGLLYIAYYIKKHGI